MRRGLLQIRKNLSGEEWHFNKDSKGKASDVLTNLVYRLDKRGVCTLGVGGMKGPGAGAVTEEGG